MLDERHGVAGLHGQGVWEWRLNTQRLGRRQAAQRCKACKCTCPPAHTTQHPMYQDTMPGRVSSRSPIGGSVRQARASHTAAVVRRGSKLGGDGEADGALGAGVAP